MKLYAILIVTMLMNGEIHQQRWHSEVYDGHLACARALKAMPKVPFQVSFCRPMNGVYH